MEMITLTGPPRGEHPIGLELEGPIEGLFPNGGARALKFPGPCCALVPSCHGARALFTQARELPCKF